MGKITMCKCGHSKWEHNIDEKGIPQECMEEFCTCPKFKPIGDYMKAPTENGYYWVRVAKFGWIIINSESAYGHIYIHGINKDYHVEDIKEWGDKIEHKEKGK